MWVGGVRASLRCKNCSLSKDFHTIPDSETELVLEQFRGSVAISAPMKVFRPGPDGFKNLSDTGHSTFNSGTWQTCVANGRPCVFWSKFDSDFYTSRLLGNNIKYFASFKLKSLTSIF